MALTDKKYEKFYKTTGTGNDKIPTDKLSFAEEVWDLDRAIGMRDHLDNPELAPLVFQLQQMQDELDYLRTEISANKSKATFPGLGKTNSTALAGDTTTISTAQANAITANTAKTTFPGFGTSNSTALVGDTKLVGIGPKTTLSFGDMVATTSKGKTTYTIALSVTTDFGGKTGSVTKSTTLTLI